MNNWWDVDEWAVWVLGMSSAGLQWWNQHLVHTVSWPTHVASHVDLHGQTGIDHGYPCRRSFTCLHESSLNLSINGNFLPFFITKASSVTLCAFVLTLSPLYINLYLLFDYRSDFFSATPQPQSVLFEEMKPPLVLKRQDFAPPKLRHPAKDWRD